MEATYPPISTNESTISTIPTNESAPLWDRFVLQSLLLCCRRSSQNPLFLFCVPQFVHSHCSLLYYTGEILWLFCFKLPHLHSPLSFFSRQVRTMPHCWGGKSWGWSLIIVTDSEDQLTHLNIRQAFQSSSSVGVAREDFEFLAIRSTRHFNDHSNSNSILKQ